MDGEERQSGPYLSAVFSRERILNQSQAKIMTHTVVTIQQKYLNALNRGITSINYLNPYRFLKFCSCCCCCFSFFFFSFFFSLFFFFFFSPRYLCSKSEQVVLIISSALQTPACLHFLPLSPGPQADIVFKASLAWTRFLLMSGPSSSQSKWPSCPHMYPFPPRPAGAIFLH